MACCGKKRSAERLARIESQIPVPLSPAPRSVPHPIAHPVKPQPVANPVKPQPTAPNPPLMPGYFVSPLSIAPAEPPVPHREVARPEPSRLEDLTDVEFQYTGSGRLTVTGPITGKIYYFSHAGETISVHGADADSLISVPGLKIVT
jgi:hypothetical protein